MGKTALRGHTAAEQSGGAGLSGQRGPGAGSVVGTVELQSRKPGDRDHVPGLTCTCWNGRKTMSRSSGGAGGGPDVGRASSWG